MVEFCTQCGTSLPKADLSIRKGEIFMSPDYLCPQCRNPAKPGTRAEPPDPEPAPGRDVVIRKGRVTSE